MNISATDNVDNKENNEDICLNVHQNQSKIHSKGNEDNVNTLIYQMQVLNLGVSALIHKKKFDLSAWCTPFKSIENITSHTDADTNSSEEIWTTPPNDADEYYDKIELDDTENTKCSKRKLSFTTKEELFIDCESYDQYVDEINYLEKSLTNIDNNIRDNEYQTGGISVKKSEKTNDIFINKNNDLTSLTKIEETFQETVDHLSEKEDLYSKINIMNDSGQEDLENTFNYSKVEDIPVEFSDNSCEIRLQTNSDLEKTRNKCLENDPNFNNTLYKEFLNSCKIDIKTVKFKENEYCYRGVTENEYTTGEQIIHKQAKLPSSPVIESLRTKFEIGENSNDTKDFLSITDNIMIREVSNFSICYDQEKKKYINSLSSIEIDKLGESCNEDENKKIIEINDKHVQSYSKINKINDILCDNEQSKEHEAFLICQEDVERTHNNELNKQSENSEIYSQEFSEKIFELSDNESLISPCIFQQNIKDSCKKINANDELAIESTECENKTMCGNVLTNKDDFLSKLDVTESLVQLTKKEEIFQDGVLSHSKKTGFVSENQTEQLSNTINTISETSLEITSCETNFINKANASLVSDTNYVSEIAENILSSSIETATLLIPNILQNKDTSQNHQINVILEKESDTHENLLETNDPFVSDKEITTKVDISVSSNEDSFSEKKTDFSENKDEVEEFSLNKSSEENLLINTDEFCSKEKLPLIEKESYVENIYKIKNKSEISDEKLLVENVEQNNNYEVQIYKDINNITAKENITNLTPDYNKKTENFFITSINAKNAGTPVIIQSPCINVKFELPENTVENSPFKNAYLDNNCLYSDNLPLYSAKVAQIQDNFNKILTPLRNNIIRLCPSFMESSAVVSDNINEVLNFDEGSKAKIVFEFPTNLLDLSIDSLENMTARNPVIPILNSKERTFLTSSTETATNLENKPADSDKFTETNSLKIQSPLEEILEKNRNLENELKEITQKYEMYKMKFETVSSIAKTVYINEQNLKKVLFDTDNNNRQLENKYQLLKEYANNYIVKLNTDLFNKECEIRHLKNQMVKNKK